VGPREVWRDLCRTIRGAVAFRRYLCSQDTIEIALGLFEAASPTARLGWPCRYVVRIANISEQTWDVNMTLQVSSMTVEPVPATPLVKFTRHCIVPPRRTTEIECHYDWRTSVVFTFDNSPSPPDECWEQELQTPQRYVVSAILTDHTGKHLDQLDIYQELKG
jgi:hypothetical protein